jgi:hypothetical protein
MLGPMATREITILPRWTAASFHGAERQSPHSTYIQVAGEGQRITAKELRKAMSASQTLHSLLLKFVQVFTVQTAHTAIANARAHIDQRLARWILMAHSYRK